MKKIFFLSLVTIAMTGCINGQFGKIKGSGHIVKESRTTGNFQAVQLAGSMDIILKQGSSFSVVVEGDDNILEYIETVVKDNTLKVGVKSTRTTWVSTKNIKVYVTLPELIAARVSGSGNIQTEDVFTTSGRFDASVSGSGNCKLNIKAQDLDAHISGSGSITISGSANNAKVGVSGSGNYKGLNFETKDADVHISGSGNVETTVNGNLEAHISGSGDVRYKGNPTIKTKTAGSGRISKI
ncbi:MAG: head GIN domain-containing protein [Chitinophagaceae bacterium]